MKTVLIDFDGVIHSYSSGWCGLTMIPDSPVPGAFDMLNSYLDNYEVFIYSTRCESQDGIDAIRSWFKRNNFERGSELQYTYWKRPAWIVIDDRVIQFNGIFPTIEEINNFKPWNKK